MILKKYIFSNTPDSWTYNGSRNMSNVHNTSPGCASSFFIWYILSPRACYEVKKITPEIWNKNKDFTYSIISTIL